MHNTRTSTARPCMHGNHRLVTHVWHASWNAWHACCLAFHHSINCPKCHAQVPLQTVHRCYIYIYILMHAYSMSSLQKTDAQKHACRYYVFLFSPPMLEDRSLTHSLRPLKGLRHQGGFLSTMLQMGNNPADTCTIPCLFNWRLHGYSLADSCCACLYVNHACSKSMRLPTM